MSTERSAASGRLWKVWLVFGLAAVGLYFTVSPAVVDGTEITYSLIGVAAVAAVAVGIRVHRPAPALPWLLICGGLASWVVGDEIYNTSAVLGVELPYPSAADPFFLLAYPLLAAGLALTVRRRRASWAGEMVEVAIIVLSASLASWMLLMRPYLDDPTATGLAKAVSISYPVNDLVLFGVMIPMIGSAAYRSLSSRLLIAWLTLLLASDVIYAGMVIDNSYISGGWVDAGWLIGYVLIGAAALHPSMAAPEQERHAESAARTIGLVTLALVAIALLAGPTLIVIATVNRDWSAAAVTACGCVLVALLVLIRLNGLAREADARRRELDQTLTQLSFQALHDHLTGLANRALFADRLQHASARFARSTSTFAVVVLDLDDLKGVNDVNGHAVGDALLIEVTRRLTASSKGSDTVARMGGDEFAILLEDLPDADLAVRAAKRVLAALQAPIVLNGRTVSASASVGVALHDPRCEPSETLRRADLAMYSAKQSGKGRVALFSAEMADATRVRIGLEQQMQHALEAVPAQFVVHYQPIVELGSDRVDAVEALVRWNHPSRGLIGPDEFLPLAEQTGLIVAIGSLVLREACRQVAQWRACVPGMSSLGVSVNLSNKQIQHAALVRDVHEAIDSTGLPPNALTLELTEELLVADATAVDDRLAALTQYGVLLSIDDFGTGNASLAYLRRFPITELKIDRSYVAGLGSPSGQPHLVRGLLDLGRALGLRIVAEGIEQRAERTALIEMGCAVGQGFLFGRPESATATEAALRAWSDAHEPEPIGA